MAHEHGQFDNAQISSYQPFGDFLDVLKTISQDENKGWEILREERMEYNGYSVIDRMNIDQRRFHSFVDESTDNPDEAWKWKGTRGLARKKAFAQHAHMTSSFVVPNVVPDNSAQEEDIMMAEGMRDIVEWQTVNSNYRNAYMLASMGSLVNPATYLRIDYREVDQRVKVEDEKGYHTEYIPDEILSGTQCSVLSTTQILITNAYIQDIQRQRAIIEREWVEYSELEAEWSHHPNWQYVRPGIVISWNDDDGLFYDIVDEDHPKTCLVLKHKNRTWDGEIITINGVYMGHENVDWNPIKHRDNRNAPKYNVVPLGHHRVNEHFFYFASLMFEVGWDDQLIDALWTVSMNRKFLDLEQPVMFSGVENVNTAVVFPGSVMSTRNPNARAQPLLPPMREDFQHIREAEDSMSESSISETQMGNLPPASQKAFTVSRAEQNAKILLTGSMQSLAEAVRKAGDLMIDIALNHLTTAQIDEISGGLKYRKFILEDQKVNGKSVSKEIRFDESLMGRNMSDKTKRKYRMKLLKESGYPKVKRSILSLNPHLFSKMKYLTRMDVDEMLPRNRTYEQIVAERMYQLMRADPLIEAEELVRNVVSAWKPKEAEKLLKRVDIKSIIGQQAGIPQGKGLVPLPAEAALA